MATLNTRRISWYLGALLFTLALGYSLFQAEAMLRGPSLTLLAPQNGAVVHEPFVTVRGTAEHAYSLHMGARPIQTREDGSFAEPFLLAEGYNHIPLVAEDRFGAKTETALEIMYEPASTVAVQNGEHMVKR